MRDYGAEGRHESLVGGNLGLDVLSRDVLATVFAASPTATLIVDCRGQICASNSALQAMFGYRDHELLHRSVAALLPDAMQSIADAAGLDETTAVDAGGRTFKVSVTVSPVHLADGDGLVASVLDRSPSSEDEHPPLVRRLREASSELQFANVAAHDLKSPLRGVSYLVEWITEELGDNTSASVANNLDRIRTRLSRMELLIDELLTYARDGATEKAHDLIVIADLIADARSLTAIPDSFTVEIDAQVAPFIGAATPLATVVRNLIANAIEHHHSDAGRVLVRARSVGDACRIEVIDDGPGIATADQVRILRPFPTANLEQRHHKGLGLAMCQRLCAAHGATIELDSHGAEGSTFVVEWPSRTKGDWT